MSGAARPRAIFFGTPEIAVEALTALDEICEVVLVVCQPDKPVGRAQEVVAPPVKRAALALGLQVHQPSKVRVPAFAELLREQRADVAVVLAYGRILTREVLAAPRLGCVNLHASLLPRSRGAAPITWAIVRGEAETGICLMQMDEGLDTGPVLTRHAIAIDPDETAGDLAKRLAALGGAVVRADLPRFLRGELTATPQVDADATFAPILTKADGRIDWTRPARAVHDHVRGMSPWPGAFTTVGEKTLKVLATQVRAQLGGAAGTIVRADKSGVVVACGDGAVELVTAQLEGRKPLAGRELAAGRTLVAGDLLGVASDGRA